MHVKGRNPCCPRVCHFLKLFCHSVEVGLEDNKRRNISCDLGLNFVLCWTDGLWGGHQCHEVRRRRGRTTSPVPEVRTACGGVFGRKPGNSCTPPDIPKHYTSTPVLYSVTFYTGDRLRTCVRLCECSGKTPSRDCTCTQLPPCLTILTFYLSILYNCYVIFSHRTPVVCTCYHAVHIDKCSQCKCSQCECSHRKAFTVGCCVVPLLRA